MLCQFKELGAALFSDFTFEVRLGGHVKEGHVNLKTGFATLKLFWDLVCY